MQREINLLCYSSQVHPDTLAVTALKEAVQGDVDWSMVLAMASLHGLGPLVYKTLNTHCRQETPVAILHRLRQEYQHSARRNFLLLGHLVSILDRFKAQGIVAVPYKGPVLAEMLYGDLALRQFGDLDIIIRRQDARRAQAILRQQGYRLNEWGTPLTEWFYMWKKGVCMYVRNDTLAVNLHWRVTMMREFQFPLQSKEFWRNLRVQQVFDHEVYTVPPEDLLLILCIHGARHYWERMRWLCDLNELIRAHPEFKWPVLLQRAQDLGDGRLVLHSLDLAHRLFQTPLDKMVLQRIEQDTSVNDLSQFILDNTLFSADPDVPKSYPEYYIHIRERWRERLWPFFYHQLYMPWRQRLGRT